MMKYIIIFLCSIILPIFSLKEMKLCINCKYFVSDNDSGKYGKCSLFPHKESKIYYLVNGINRERQYYHCSLARQFDDMCGEEGKMYKKKYIRNLPSQKP